MVAFLVGFAAPYAVLLGWALRSEEWVLRGAGARTGLVWLVLLIPVASAWAAGELVNLASRRRLFDRRRRGRLVQKGALGLVAGVVGAGAGMALLPIVDPFVHDGLTMGAAAALASAAAVMLLPRVRRGCCVHCGYDLRDGPGPGRAGSGVCPECGASALA